MARINRERLLVNFLIVVVAGFILDQAVIGPWLDSRADLVTQRDNGRHALELGKLTLQQEKELHTFISSDGKSMLSDAATIEERLIHLVHDWEQQTGITNLSFQRTTAIAEHGFTRLTFSISADGALTPIAGLIYRTETSPIPLRVDNVSVHPRTGATDVLQMNLTVSALCQGRTQTPSPAVAESSVSNDTTEPTEAKQ